MDQKRPYPKIWGTGNPGVGRGSQRHLGGPFQTHAGGGAIARNKGKFSEIILDQSVQDGWFSLGNQTKPPIPVRGATRPTAGFGIRANRPSSAYDVLSKGIFPSSRGWGWLVDDATLDAGVYTSIVRRSFNGGKVATPLFAHSQGIGLNFGFLFYSFTAYLGAPSLCMSYPTFITQDIVRQRPRIRVYYRDTGVWYSTDIPMMTSFFSTNEDYTFGPFTTQAPANFVTIVAKYGEKPHLFTTYNYGTNWTDDDMDALGFFPGFTWPTLTYPTQASAPGANATARRTNFLAQTDMDKYINMSQCAVDALSLRRVIVTTPAYYTGTNYRITTTVFDTYNGTVEEQFWDTLPANPQWSEIYNIPIGEDSFIHQHLRWDSTPADPANHDVDFNAEYSMDVSTDGGATLDAIVPHSELRDFSVVVGAARPNASPNPIWPKIYYTTRENDNSRQLWASSDLFVTNTKQSTIAPATGVTYNNDFNTVAWIGTPGPQTAGPCDPCVPWRLDTRVVIPSWWYDGIPEP